ncbi:hypothetical protein D3C72_743130 [compost metagenome]
MPTTIDVYRLNELRPGDLLFERGEPKVAAAFGPREGFGHVGVAITRLCWLHAGLDGVKLQLMPAHICRTSSGETFIGVTAEGPTQLMRSMNPPLQADIWSRAVGEIGRNYASRLRLLALGDLTLIGQRSLRSPNQLLAETENSLIPGRICSESSARVLGLRDPFMSPAALERTPDLRIVQGGVAQGSSIGPPVAMVEAAKELAAANTPHMNRLVKRLLLGVASLRGADKGELATFSEVVDKAVCADIATSLRALTTIQTYENLAIEALSKA